MNTRMPGAMRSGVSILILAIVIVAGGIVVWKVPSPISVGRQDNSETESYPASSVLPEIEATEFNGIDLVAIKDQGNNAIIGTRHIDRKSYRLEVTGLVENPLSMSYDELLRLPMVSEAVYMPCIEGWGFMAKWTGFKVADLLDMAGVKSEGTYVMFYSDDGYSTGDPLSFIRDNDIILAFGLNDVTLPDDRGFPFQLVAKSKYGYKWAKWITKIEVLDHEELGYWEQRGYSNSADVGD